MPELPEVETIRRALEPALLARRIERVRVLRRDVVIAPGDPPGGLARSNARPQRLHGRELLAGAVVAELPRLGKRLGLIADDGRAIDIHLGMSGQLLLQESARLPSHAHIVWRLDGGRCVVFRDPRRFGGVRVHASHEDLLRCWNELGPDALTIAGGDLRERAGGSSRSLKCVLLDQRVLAGVGNIYADEALFEARLHPAARARDLAPRAWNDLARAIRDVLERAIELRGSTLRDYRNADGSPGSAQLAHRVYARAGLPCTRCGDPLASAQMTQRTTTWCPRCQDQRNDR